MNSDNASSQERSPETAGGEWWLESLSRRRMNATLASSAALLAMAGVASSCDDDDNNRSHYESDDVESQKSATELQQKEGWNVGSKDTALKFPDKQTADSRGQDWKPFAQPAALLQAYQPSATWKPYFVPTLIQGLAQESLRNSVQPVCSAAMREAYSRGLGMKEILAKSKKGDGTLLIADIPGAEAVAFAAALADVAQPVLVFDNLPHPLGVAPSHLTLGALLYYAGEVSAKAAKRPAAAPAVLVLDSARLAPYTDADDQFDNRYMAKLPTADNLKALGIKTVLYAAPNETQKTELDDLNDDFAAFQEKGIAVSMISLSRFESEQASAALAADSSKKLAAQPPQQQQQTQQQNLTPQQQQPQQQPQQQYAPGGGVAYYPQPVYHYGGNPLAWYWFFHHYPSTYVYYRTLPPVSKLPPTRYQTASYQVARRPTMFSSTSVGGNRSSGIGKQRPTGFGFVAVRTSARTGSLSGVRAGRSGSFGRSSFGGGRSS